MNKFSKRSFSTCYILGPVLGAGNMKSQPVVSFQEFSLLVGTEKCPSVTWDVIDRQWCGDIEEGCQRPL